MTRMCAACGRGIMWRKTLGGAGVELDAEPTEQWVLTGRDHSVCTPVQAYTLHANTCPARNGHRPKPRATARVKP